MIPHSCQSTHNPPHSYGDCLRACFASILERDDVPHFYHDGCSVEEGEKRIKEYLSEIGRGQFRSLYSGDASLAEILIVMEANAADIHYILAGSTGETDHVVVCKGGKIVHNPAWYGSQLKGPLSTGVWIVTVIAVK